MQKKRILSGVQPTGAIHIGNWLGAIRNWVSLQEEFETYVCVVDLHAITVPHNPKKLKEDTLTTAALYIACGIDPRKCAVFVQSHIPAHSELCWILNCITPLNWMERMIQFKEKAVKQGDNVSIGLLDYPILMAADILLYEADLVPVGEDQKQHLELARNIAQQRINTRFGKENTSIIKVPQPLIMKDGAKIMSLCDGNNKMSKSDPNENSRINLLDTPEMISKKIKRAKTDAHLGLEFDNPNRPESDNLLTIYSMVTKNSRDLIMEQCADIGWGKFKPILTEAIVEALKPIQEKYNSLMKEKSELIKIIVEGNQMAEEVSSYTLERVKNAFGFLETIKN